MKKQPLCQTLQYLSEPSIGWMINQLSEHKLAVKNWLSCDSTYFATRQIEDRRTHRVTLTWLVLHGWAIRH